MTRRGYADAEPLYKRSLSIREKALGPDHPHVGTTLNNLANAQRRFAEAEPLLKRAEHIPGWEVADIPILFATNRNPEPRIAGWLSFGARQETDVAKVGYGKSTVRAPKSEVENRANRSQKRLASAIVWRGSKRPSQILPFVGTSSRQTAQAWPPSPAIGCHGPPAFRTRPSFSCMATTIALKMQCAAPP